MAPSPTHSRWAVTGNPRAAIGAASAGGNTQGGCLSLLKPVPVAQGQHSAGSALPAEVLIIGAGCTGALTAALFRREALRRQPSMRPRVSVWEWGRGPAGRMTSFWAEVDGSKILADVGAQVVSLRDAARLPAWLRPLLRQAEPSVLSSTSERSSDWCHFFAPSGLPSLQHASLQHAEPAEIHFNRRVVEMAPSTAGEQTRWRVGHSERSGRRAARYQEFDAVVFAGTARDASSLQGVRDALTPQQVRALSGVRYDHRLCTALILPVKFRAKLDALCTGKAELLVRTQGKAGPLELVARQDVKDRESVAAIAVTLHSTTAFAAQNLQDSRHANKSPTQFGQRRLVAAFAELLSMPLGDLESLVIDSKVVHWRQCQVRHPFQNAILQDTRPCLVAGIVPGLVLAGDYFADSSMAGSFEGCLESADAAARAVCDMLWGTDAHVQDASASASAATDSTRVRQVHSRRDGAPDIHQGRGSSSISRASSSSRGSSKGTRGSSRTHRTPHQRSQDGQRLPVDGVSGRSSWRGSAKGPSGKGGSRSARAGNSAGECSGGRRRRWQRKEEGTRSSATRPA